MSWFRVDVQQCQHLASRAPGTVQLCRTVRPLCSALPQQQQTCSRTSSREECKGMHTTGGRCDTPWHLYRNTSAQVLSAHALLAAGQLHFTGIASAAEAAAQQLSEGTSIAPVDLEHFQPGPVDVGWQIWVGAAAGVIPFAIGAYEFGKRILIQRRCKVCSGKGLVASSRGQGRLRKCPVCGGFFPWVSWRLFLTSNATPGNGGPLLQPKGQTSVFYKVPAPPQRQQQEGQQQQGARAPDGSQEAGRAVDDADVGTGDGRHAGKVAAAQPGRDKHAS